MLYKDIEEELSTGAAWGMSACIDVSNCDKDLIKNRNAIEIYVHDLCADVIKMKRFQSTIIVNFGDDPRVAGFSMMQLIETSSITGHFANLTRSVYIDIFSCKNYDPFKAAEFTRNFFMGTHHTLQLHIRR